MPTSPRRPAAPGTLTIPPDMLRALGWSTATALSVECELAWSDRGDEPRPVRCLMFTITAAAPVATTTPTRRTLRKVA